MRPKRYPYQGRKKELSVLPLDPGMLSAIGVAVAETLAPNRGSAGEISHQIENAICRNLPED